MSSELATQLLPYVAVAAGFLLCLYLAAVVRGEVNQLRRRVSEQEEMLQALKQTQPAVRDGGEHPSASAPARRGLNGATRAKALRLLEMGREPRDIAEALHVTQADVTLLNKVHQLAAH